MAKNIKKRSASHIYFGVNKLTGELKHISEVPSGQKCNCICAACLQPFEARKGTRRRHHFAHVSNYECMYASEVAIYKAIAEALKQSGFLTLPPVMLRFPAWHDPELLQEARRLKIDSVAFECEPLSYPPLLRVTMQGTPLRILLDFDRYYDNDDRVELAEEAKVEDYSLLLISIPKHTVLAKRNLLCSTFAGNHTDYKMECRKDTGGDGLIRPAGVSPQRTRTYRLLSFFLPPFPAPSRVSEIPQTTH